MPDIALMGAADGKHAVVGDAMAAASRDLANVRAEPEQIGMFPVPTRHTGARADALQAAIAAQRRRAGRPAGATNKASAELREYLLARGVDPLQQLMRWAMHTPVSLAAELKCTPLEAFDRLKSIWDGLTPFFHAKLAQIDGQTGETVPTFNVTFGGALAADPRPPWLREHIEQNQQVIDAVPAVSHGDVSHEDGK